MKIRSSVLFPALALVASAMIAVGQDNPPPTPPEAGSTPAQKGQERGQEQGRERRQWNPEEFRQRMNERIKASLKVSDEEWTAIQPLIEKVQNKMRESMGGRFGGFGGRGGRGPGGDQADRPGAAETEALRTALDNDSSSTDDIKAKLEAVREQRKKSAAELAAAREDLRKVLTVRQEAALVMMGILE